MMVTNLIQQSIRAQVTLKPGEYTPNITTHPSKTPGTPYLVHASWLDVSGGSVTIDRN